MADWIVLEKKQYLTVEDMSAFANNFNYIRDYFLSFGLNVGELKDITVTYDISPLDIQQKFNDMEYNIQTLQKVIDSVFKIDIKTFKKYTWKKHPSNLKKEVWRWIDWFNEVKSWSIGYTYLRNINDEIITDVNGEALQVLKAYKEEE